MQYAQERSLEHPIYVTLPSSSFFIQFTISWKLRCVQLLFLRQGCLFGLAFFLSFIHLSLTQVQKELLLSFAQA